MTPHPPELPREFTLPEADVLAVIPSGFSPTHLAGGRTVECLHWSEVDTLEPNWLARYDALLVLDCDLTGERFAELSAGFVATLTEATRAGCHAVLCLPPPGTHEHDQGRDGRHRILTVLDQIVREAIHDLIPIGGGELDLPPGWIKWEPSLAHAVGRDAPAFYVETNTAEPSSATSPRMHAGGSRAGGAAYGSPFWTLGDGEIHVVPSEPRSAVDVADRLHRRSLQIAAASTMRRAGKRGDLLRTPPADEVTDHGGPDATQGDSRTPKIDAATWRFSDADLSVSIPDLPRPLLLTAPRWRVLKTLYDERGRIVASAKLHEAAGSGAEGSHRDIVRHLRAAIAAAGVPDARKPEIETRRGEGYVLHVRSCRDD